MKPKEREEFNKWILEKEPVVEFSLRECKLIFLKSWHRRFLIAQDVDLYIVEVESRKLEEIKTLYKLPETEYPYHITLGIRYRGYL